MRVALRDAPAVGSRLRSHRVLVAGALLAACIVVASGITGTTHFSGPRWAPNVRLPKGHPRSPKPPSTRPGHVHRSHLPLWPLYVIAGVVVAALLIAAAWWLIGRWQERRGRTRRAAATPSAPALSPLLAIPTEPEPEPDAPAVRDGIESALRALDEPREPADAVVRAWLGLTETAERSGIERRPAETPTEFTSRIIGRALRDDRAIRALLALYLRTRFGEHPVTADDVALARAALAELVRTWPAHPLPAGARAR